MLHSSAKLVQRIRWDGLQLAHGIANSRFMCNQILYERFRLQYGCICQHRSSVLDPPSSHQQCQSSRAGRPDGCRQKRHWRITGVFHPKADSLLHPLTMHSLVRPNRWTVKSYPRTPYSSTSTSISVPTSYLHRIEVETCLGSRSIYAGVRTRALPFSDGIPHHLLDWKELNE